MNNFELWEKDFKSPENLTSRELHLLETEIRSIQKWQIGLIGGMIKDDTNFRNKFIEEAENYQKRSKNVISKKYIWSLFKKILEKNKKSSVNSSEKEKIGNKTDKKDKNFKEKREDIQNEIGFSDKLAFLRIKLNDEIFYEREKLNNIQSFPEDISFNKIINSIDDDLTSLASGNFLRSLEIRNLWFTEEETLRITTYLGNLSNHLRLSTIFDRNLPKTITKNNYMQAVHKLKKILYQDTVWKNSNIEGITQEHEFGLLIIESLYLNNLKNNLSKYNNTIVI